MYSSLLESSKSWEDYFSKLAIESLREIHTCIEKEIINRKLKRKGN